MIRLITILYSSTTSLFAFLRRDNSISSEIKIVSEEIEYLKLSNESDIVKMEKN